MCRQDQKSPEWNANAGKPRKSRSKPPLKEQTLLEDYALRHGAAVTRSVQILADVATLGREHDLYGLLQMPPEGVPGLGDVAHVLLHTYALLDLFLMVRGSSANTH